MAIEFITADDKDGYFSDTADTDVFVKAGVVLGSQVAALLLNQTGHDVTVQGAVVGSFMGVDLGPTSTSSSTVANCTLSVAEGGLIAGFAAARLYGSGNHVTNNGDIMGQLLGLQLAGMGGASTVENFGLISATSNAVVIDEFFTQAVTLRNTGEIAGGDASYLGGGGVDTIVNQCVMNGNIVLGSGNDAYRGGLGALDSSVSGGSGKDQII